MAPARRRPAIWHTALARTSGAPHRTASTTRAESPGASGSCAPATEEERRPDVQMQRSKMCKKYDVEIHYSRFSIHNKSMSESRLRFLIWHFPWKCTSILTLGYYWRYYCLAYVTPGVPGESAHPAAHTAGAPLIAPAATLPIRAARPAVNAQLGPIGGGRRRG